MEPWEHGAINRAVQMLDAEARKNESTEDPYGGLIYADDADALRFIERRLLNTEAECLRLRRKLQEIEQFGHAEGHGRGYTCATMAQDALKGLN